MKLQDLMEAKLITGLSGRFDPMELKDGRWVMSFVTDDGDRYIINASLRNYIRFKKWENKRAYADIEKTGKKIKIPTGEKYPLIRIRTEVEVDKKHATHPNAPQVVF